MTAALTFTSLNPATAKVVGTHPIDDAETVNAVVARARGAADWWAALAREQRRAHLLAWKKLIVRRMDELAALMRAETGKPLADAKLEIVLAVEHLDWAARNARKVFEPRGVFPGLLMINHAASLEYHPLGVVGVIGPWNYPVYTPMGSIAYALAAGNAVVFKPSEYTPGVGRWLADSFAEAVAGPPVLQVVTGRGDTGAALCRSGVDKIAFTGSTATAKRVMAACAERLTPVVVEGGGKDALIVAADADIAAAADAAVFGAMSNAGQTCVGVERIYVVAEVYDEFVREFTTLAATLEAGSGDTAKIGAITMPDQIKIIARHIGDALDRGARAVVGGTASVRPPFVDPVVLVEVPDDAAAITEETFGPTVTITRVRDVEEAVTKANAIGYGLASSVFSRNKTTALDVARRLRTGATAINAVMAFAAIPGLPFGGVGDSGFGRIHGPDGLREFSRSKAITRQRFAPVLPLLSFSRSDKDLELALRLVRLLHGR